MSDTVGQVEIYIPSGHPDYAVCYDQSNQARRLYNTLLACFKEWWAYKDDPNADTHITKELGITLDPDKFPDLEAWQKIICVAQDIRLNSKLRQQVRKKLNESLRSVWALRRKGQSASLPSYKRGGLCELNFIRQTLSGYQARVIDDKQNKVIPTGWSHGIQLPTFIKPSQVKSLQIVPVGNGFEAHILYTKPYKQGTSKGKHKAGIDPGVNNLLTCFTTNPKVRPVTVSGKPLKAINQNYNKEAARLRGELSKAKEEDNPLEQQRLRLELDCLAFKRHNQIEHYLNTVTSALGLWLVRTGVRDVALGWSEADAWNGIADFYR